MSHVDDVKTLIAQIIPQANEQQVIELQAAIISAKADYPFASPDGKWSDAGCVLLSLVGGSREEFFRAPG